MLSKQYLLTALNGNAYKYKAWIFDCFSLMIKKGSTDYPFYLVKGDKKYSFYNTITEQVEIIEDSDSSKPLFTFQDVINITPGEVPNLKQNVTTTVGQLLTNFITLIDAFDDKIEYQNGEFNIDFVESIISERLVTDKQYSNKDDYKSDSPIYVSEYLNYINNITSLEGITQLSVPSASPRTLTTDPNIVKRKKELLEENKDNLTDPAVIAKIESELVEMDRQWIKGDASEGFYIKDKHYGEVRKKAHVMYGLQSGFGEVTHLSTNSLDQGWEIEKMPGMINSLREGTYARGHGTAMGGYETKIVNRMLQNLAVGKDDCGTQLGWDVKFNKSNAKNYIGLYYLDKNKKTFPITKENYQSFIGQDLTVRSPQFCKETGTQYCKKCLGDQNSESTNALSSYIAEITSELMLISMAKMHTTQIKTVEFDINKSIY